MVLRVKKSRDGYAIYSNNRKVSASSANRKGAEERLAKIKKIGKRL